MQFLTFLCAIIKGVHEYAPLLRLSAASAGNDHRLGANEAPPAVVSIFIGDDLQKVLDALENGTNIKTDQDLEFVIGVDALPNFRKDATDRNRTSPFAFTGNKFEFRMLGSADSISCTNTIMNTIVAQELCEFADKLEQAEDFDKALKELLIQTIKEHKAIIFNGNGYSDEWLEEAARRGLPNLVSTVDALPHYMDPQNIAMFEKFHVYTKEEIASRTDILLENYSKVINIEAMTMLDMTKKKLLPAAMEYGKKICDTAIAKKQLGLDASAETKLAADLDSNTAKMYEAMQALESKVNAAKEIGDVLECAKAYRSQVFSAMSDLRTYADQLEMLVSAEDWPLPPYSDLLFNV